MHEFKVLSGTIYGTNLVHKILSESATIRTNARKCHIQKNIKKVKQSKYFQEVSQSNVLPGNASKCRIIGTARQSQNVHPGSAAIKSTSRKCRNQKYCQVVLQSKVLPESFKIKSTSRDRHNQQYCEGPQQSKVMPGSAAIKYIQ